jgi:hypothetical protein
MWNGAAAGDATGRQSRYIAGSAIVCFPVLTNHFVFPEEI